MNKRLAFLVTVLIGLMIGSVCVSAETETGKCGDNAYYELTDDGTLTISGTGDMYNWTSYEDGPFYNQQRINKVIIKDEVSSIGAAAFYGCTKINTVELSDNIKAIGEYAFMNCTSLESIDIPSGITIIEDGTFANCEKLKRVSIPEGVSQIGAYAFMMTLSLDNVTIPHSVTKFGKGVFYGGDYNKTIYYKGTENEWELITSENDEYKDFYYAEVIFLGGVCNSHNFSEIYTWSSDLSKCSLTLSCKNCDEKVNLSCKVTKDVTKEPTCKEKGKAVYSAIADYNDVNYCEKKNKTLNIVDHKYETKVEKVATMYSDGITAKRCKFCNRKKLGSEKTIWKIASIELDRIAYTYTGLAIKPVVTVLDSEGNTVSSTYYSVTFYDSNKNKISGDIVKVKGYYAIIKLKGRYSGSFKRIFSVNEKKYSITYKNVNGAKNSNPSKYVYTKSSAEKTLTLKNLTGRKGYTFAGWYSDNELKNSISSIDKSKGKNVTVYAKWKASTITVTLHDVFFPATHKVKYTEKWTLPDYTQKTVKGYKFDGWYTDYSYYDQIKVIPAYSTKDITVYSKWSPVKYKITYKNMDGAIPGSEHETSYDITQTIALASPTKKGYTFAGWYKDAGFTAEPIKEITKGTTGNKTFYARWIKNKDEFTLTYMVDNEVFSTNIFHVTDEVKLIRPTKVGYSFDGWYLDENCTTKIEKLQKGSFGNKTVYGKWVRTANYIKSNSEYTDWQVQAYGPQDIGICNVSSTVNLLNRRLISDTGRLGNYRFTIEQVISVTSGTNIDKVKKLEVHKEYPVFGYATYKYYYENKTGDICKRYSVSDKTYEMVKDDISGCSTDNDLKIHLALLLDQHPEGVILYNVLKSGDDTLNEHAIVITRYERDGDNYEFFALDPVYVWQTNVKGFDKGEIPVSSVWKANADADYLSRSQLDYLAYIK